MEKNNLDLKKIKQTLEEKRAVLLTRVHIKGDQGQSNTLNPDRSELAQDYFLRDRNSALRERLEETLIQVEDALQRLEEGTYGNCTRCGGEIDHGRLHVLPQAELCIDCQKDEEDHHW